MFYGDWNTKDVNFLLIKFNNDDNVLQLDTTFINMNFGITKRDKRITQRSSFENYKLAQLYRLQIGAGITNRSKFLQIGRGITKWGRDYRSVWNSRCPIYFESLLSFSIILVVFNIKTISGNIVRRNLLLSSLEKFLLRRKLNSYILNNIVETNVMFYP